MLLQIWHFTTYPHSAQSGFASHVGVRARQDGLHLGEQVSGHFDGGDVPESAEGKPDDVLIRVVEVTVPVSTRHDMRPRRPTF